MGFLLTTKILDQTLERLANQKGGQLEATKSPPQPAVSSQRTRPGHPSKAENFQTITALFWPKNIEKKSKNLWPLSPPHQQRPNGKPRLPLLPGCKEESQSSPLLPPLSTRVVKVKQEARTLAVRSPTHSVSGDRRSTTWTLPSHLEAVPFLFGEGPY